MPFWGTDAFKGPTNIGAVCADNLFSKGCHPVEYDGDWRLGIGWRIAEQEPLAIGCDVVRGRQAAGFAPLHDEPCAKQRNRGSEFQRGLVLHRHGCYELIAGEVEQLAAVPAPPGHSASFCGNLACSARRRETLNIDFVATGFIGGIRDPVSIRGYLRLGFIVGRLQELDRRSIAPQIHRSQIQNRARELLKHDESPVARPVCNGGIAAGDVQNNSLLPGVDVFDEYSGAGRIHHMSIV